MTRLVLALAILAAGLLIWAGPWRRPGPGTAAFRPDHVSPVRPPRSGDLFVDVTLEAGLDFVFVLVDGEMSNLIESQGSGAAFIDCDNDGFLDIYFVQTGWIDRVVEGPRPASLPENHLYRNRGDGTFEDVTGRARVGDTGFGMAAVAADYDGDGFADLYVCNAGPNVLYRNRGDGTFEDVTRRAGVEEALVSVGATFFDYDGDSRLDLYVTNYLEFDPDYKLYYTPDGFPPPIAYEAQPDALYRNRGDGTFENVSEASGISKGAGRGMSVLASDIDDDGRTDIFVSNDATANFLWHNNGDGTFKDVAVEYGVAFGEDGEATAAMTADWGDYNRDGRLDLVVTDAAYGSLYSGVRPGLFVDEVVSSGMGALNGQYVSWGGGFLDFDNDADLDLLIVNGDLHHVLGWEDLLLRNDGKGEFSDAAATSVYFEQKMMGRGGAAADFDNDGDLDILITNILDRPVLLRNDSPRENAWIDISLRAEGGNRSAYGARVAVKAGQATTVREVRCPTVYLCSADPRLHFGLGRCDRVDSIEIAWPSGDRQVLEGVEPNRHLTVRQQGKKP